MLIRIAVLSFALCLVSGCSTPIATSPAGNSPRSASFNTAQKTTAPTATSQRLAAGETPASRGYSDGYGDATISDPRNPDRWLPQLGFSAADQQIYRQEYYRGYDSVTTISPPPPPTGSISPDRKAELQRRGRQDGLSTAQSGFDANPGQGITALGLTDPTEIRIYTTAYNNGYQRQPSPTPAPTLPPQQLAQVRQQGYNDGYNDAQSNFPQDTNRGITLLGLVNNAEQRAYTNGYNNGYQTYISSQQPLPSVLW
ncbi:hypothetical protein [Stenomitos frigidus]|uniref:Uncharacterized protein n=1 Tax=Stenomitos frigidus ULC18 TaxID=2107698 RepID=A0A2T1E9N5_9CYAN|nr:hypothetical protein [Stenomitos frigidus]PSB29462.1 hypothetical protein C7B82_11635 [Stenomitos frigidus ULC18]